MQKCVCVNTHCQVSCGDTLLKFMYNTNQFLNLICSIRLQNINYMCWSYTTYNRKLYAPVLNSSIQTRIMWYLNEENDKHWNYKWENFSEHTWESFKMKKLILQNFKKQWTIVLPPIAEFILNKTISSN